MFYEAPGRQQQTLIRLTVKGGIFYLKSLTTKRKLRDIAKNVCLIMGRNNTKDD